MMKQLKKFVQDSRKRNYKIENNHLVVWHKNEGDELNKKIAELELLKKRLVEKELEFAQQQAELYRFEIEYTRIIGQRYAKLDELKAQLAELLQILHPYDSGITEDARKAREQARESAQGINSNTQPKFTPTENIKQLYREAAKRVHPDFAKDETERAYRTRIMVKLNQAYKIGNETKLKEIIDQWNSDEQYINENDDNSELAYLNLQILRIQQRLAEIDGKLAKLRSSDLYQIKLKADNLKELGRDLLQEMAIELDKQIEETKFELQIESERVENCV